MPIILDENLIRSGRNVAEELRKVGYNDRDIKELCGTQGVLDKEILDIAKTLNARVLTLDRGRKLDGGFMNLAIQVDQRAISTKNLLRYLNEAVN